jgi:hypothetical protein
MCIIWILILKNTFPLLPSLQLNPYVAYEIPYSHSFEICIQ